MSLLSAVCVVATLIYALTHPLPTQAHTAPYLCDHALPALLAALATLEHLEHLILSNRTHLVIEGHTKHSSSTQSNVE